MQFRSRLISNVIFYIVLIFFLGFLNSCENDPGKHPENGDSSDILTTDTTIVDRWVQQGQTLYDSSEYDQAIYWLKRADSFYLQLPTLTDDSLRIEKIWYVTDLLAKSYLNVKPSQLDSAWNVLERSILRFQHFFPNGSAEEANAVALKAGIYMRRNDWSNGTRLYLKASDILNELEEELINSARLRSIAAVYSSYSEPQRAYVWSEQAVKQIDSVWNGTGSELGEIYHNHATVLSNNGRVSEGISCAKKALQYKIDHYGPSHIEVGKTYNNLAIGYLEIGEYETALEIQQKNQEIREKIFSFPNRYLSNTYHNIGILYSRLHEYHEALKFYEEAYRNCETLNESDLSPCARIVMSQTNLLNNMSRYDATIDILQKNASLISKDQMYNRDLISGFFSRMGEAYLGKKEFEKALEYLQKALRDNIDVYGANNSHVALAYDDLGQLYGKWSKPEESIRNHQLAIAIMDNLPDKNIDDLAYMLNNKALSLADTKDFETALDQINKAIALLAPEFTGENSSANPSSDHQPVLDAYVLWFVSQNKADILRRKYLNSGAPKDALSCRATYLWSDGLLTRLLNDRFWEGSRIELLNETKGVYEEAISFAGRAYSETNDRMYLDLCFYFMERTRALLLTEGFNSRRFAPIHLTDWMEREKLLKSKIKALELEKSETSNKKEDYDTQQVDDDLFQVKERYAVLVDSLQLIDPEYYNARFQLRNPDISEVQKAVTSYNTLILEYYLSPEALTVLSIGKDRVKLHQRSLKEGFSTQLRIFLEKYRQFDDNAGKLSNEIEAKQENFIRLSRMLYDTLLAPILDEAEKVDQLVIIPHGKLGYLPFEVLLTTDATDNSYRNLPYLIKDYSVRYEYSTYFIVEEGGEAAALENDFIGFAPTYPKDDFLDKHGPATQEKISIAFPNLRDRAQPLLYNQSEVEEIAESMEGKAILGRKATKENFFTEAGKGKILHLAMHAFINDTFPEYSHFVFTPKGSGVVGNNYLYAYELYAMQCNADLAVLSGCETGAGKISDGEGIMSLSRAFKYAGCSNIVTSLWKAEDQSTKEIMVKFYSYLKAGKGKSDALRQAKIDYLQQAEQRFTSPIFWSNFVLLGDNSPVLWEESNSSWLVWFLTGMLLIIVSALTWWRLKSKKSATTIPT